MSEMINDFRPKVNAKVVCGKSGRLPLAAMAPLSGMPNARNERRTTYQTHITNLHQS
jgi:hypothetical protein